ncbi:unnamed protein product [Ostreobium quekettii]|uniref:Uncharacterized protein n=1 Tax=Ostreobium quekettii TaxID=121088 RepID=A0A8S1JDI7_9CHLO|nr:unnamed protein product [Ostreobium quekettii]
MIGQLIRLLWTHQSQEETGEFFVLACTGDHSTPVVFGDHSHEPVPFGVAHLRDVVATLGGTAVVDSISLGPIVNPDSGDETAVERVSEQARRQKEFRKLESAAIEGHGDIPCRFNEVSAARGELGRFPGREIFAIFKQLVNVGTDVGNQEMVS